MTTLSSTTQHAAIPLTLVWARRKGRGFTSDAANVGNIVIAVERHRDGVMGYIAIGTACGTTQEFADVRAARKWCVEQLQAVLQARYTNEDTRQYAPGEMGTRRFAYRRTRTMDKQLREGGWYKLGTRWAQATQTTEPIQRMLSVNGTVPEWSLHVYAVDMVNGGWKRFTIVAAGTEVILRQATNKESAELNQCKATERTPVLA